MSETANDEEHTQTFTDVVSITFYGADPNGYHKEEEGFDECKIVLEDGTVYVVVGCRHCGFLLVVKEGKVEK